MEQLFYCEYREDKERPETAESVAMSTNVEQQKGSVGDLAQNFIKVFQRSNKAFLLG
jgi:hypothetical protein